MQAATLTIMVGGRPETFERARPILEALGKNIRLVGPTGVGSTIKLANQLLAAVNTATVAEAMVLATKAGADPRVAFDVLKTGFGGSAMLTRNVPMMLDRNFGGGTTITLMLKDLGLIDALSAETGVPTFLAAVAAQEYRLAKALGLANDDISGLVRLIERDAGVEVK